jgi:hypothetical protein
MRFQSSFPATISQQATDSPNVYQVPALFSKVINPNATFNDEGEIIDHKVRHRTAGNKSGSPCVLIPGETKRLTVILRQLLISWNNVTVYGHIEINSFSLQPISIYQGESGYLVVPCHNEHLYLGEKGLTVSNNSLGGNYSITVYFSLEDL